jgi:hypothetical protein
MLTFGSVSTKRCFDTLPRGHTVKCRDMLTLEVYVFIHISKKDINAPLQPLRATLISFPAAHVPSLLLSWPP